MQNLYSLIGPLYGELQYFIKYKIGEWNKELKVSRGGGRGSGNGVLFMLGMIFVAPNNRTNVNLFIYSLVLTIGNCAKLM